MSALDQLLRSATHPDRLAYASQALTVGAVLVDEGLPCRDDAGRVTSHGRHVSQLHPLGVTIEDGSQRCKLGGIDHDHDRIASRDGIVDERRRARKELAVVGVKERLVAKAVVRCHRPWSTHRACTDFACIEHRPF